MNKVCLITGAASGLGFEFSKLAAGDQYDLVLIDKNGQELENSKRVLEQKYNVTVETLHLDLSLRHVCNELYPLIKNKPVEILINNAGFGLYGKFSETDYKVEEKMISLHILTATRLTKLILKDMLARGRGKIMNVSSLASFQPGPHFAVYSASKAYLRSFSEAVATEIKGTGVTVTVFCPGQTNTNFAKQVALRSGSKESNVPLFTSDAVKVASIGYRGMMKGKILVIPGFFNKIFAVLSQIIPGTVTSRINGKVQTRIRKKTYSTQVRH